MKENNIQTNHSLKEYKKKYKRHLKSLLNFSNKDIVDFDKKYNTNKVLLKNRDWWYIDGVYYEAPKSVFFNKIKHLKIGYKIAICTAILALLGLKTYHSVRMLLPSYSVSLVNEPKDTHLEMIGEKIAKRGEDYTVKFKIDYMYELNRDNIHVYIDGFEKRCWTFRYQTNVKNELIIDKKYIHGDISIKAVATHKTTPSFLFGIEDNNTYVQDNLNVVVKTGDERKVVEKIAIPQLSGEKAYPIYEDDCFEATFTIKTGASITTISEDFWFRTNARWGREKSESEDYDFERTFNEGKTEVIFKVPHFIVRDNCEFRVKS